MSSSNPSNLGPAGPYLPPLPITGDIVLNALLKYFEKHSAENLATIDPYVMINEIIDIAIGLVWDYSGVLWGGAKAGIGIARGLDAFKGPVRAVGDELKAVLASPVFQAVWAAKDYKNAQRLIISVMLNTQVFSVPASVKAEIMKRFPPSGGPPPGGGAGSGTTDGGSRRRKHKRRNYKTHRKAYR